MHIQMNNKSLKQITVIRNTEIIRYERDYIWEQGKSRTESMEVVLRETEPGDQAGFEDPRPLARRHVTVYTPETQHLKRKKVKHV